MSLVRQQLSANRETIKERTMLLYTSSFITGLLCLVLFQDCNTSSAAGKSDFHFSLLDKSHTGIDFNNKVTESDSVNFYTNEYMYIGAGVAVGDFNNDGLQDIFFCGSQVSCRLYLNKGDFKFEDITQSAGVQTSAWCTGVSVVDINNDGLPDIYVCVSGSRQPEKRKNLLFINQGNLRFKEEAAEYGLDDMGYSTQAAFFDYDKDGRLDMYLLNHRLYNDYPNAVVPKDTSGNSPAADKLYRNMGIRPGTNHPYFKDVSKEAGIKEDGYGLGVTISDFNNDGWPDIYVANDYIGNDLLWLNNKNGTFSNCISRSLRHQSYNSMGVDAADINNDQLPDLAVLDMLPETNERKKMMFSGVGPEKYDMERRMGYEPEFTRNMLQLHNGNRSFNNKSEPFFSEIGQLAGVAETDWSWSVLIADFDNDGWKDMHITNGLEKDLTNNDYVYYRRDLHQGGYGFGDAKQQGMDKKALETLRERLDACGRVQLNNYMFRSNGDLTFTNSTGDCGMATPSVSNGALYADLDNDGDLDLVVNNMNQEAFVWKNETRQSIADSSNNFLTLRLEGDSLNTAGIGAKITLYNKGGIQFIEQYPVRGYSSSVDNRPHFGLSGQTSIDSLKVVWPDDKSETEYGVKANQLLTLDHAKARAADTLAEIATRTLFTAIPAAIDFKHDETPFFDFGYQRLLPQKYSQLGPPLATGDVNGDGLMDFFVGGAAGQPGKIAIQQKDGSFLAKDILAGQKREEDIGAAFIDVDGDKDLDLLITTGSTELGMDSGYNHPRLYINDGKGNFTLDEAAIPPGVTGIAQAIAVGDYDGDGDMDIFIGGRVSSARFPSIPRSYLLQNNHGRFTDVTQEVCPELAYPGMITSAVWSDFNNDKKPGLVLCGEWMPVRFFKNTGKKLEEVTSQTGLTNMTGLWRSLQAVDIDNDGDIDYVVGNMGWNNDWHIAPGRPMELYAKDFDGNGSMDLISANYVKNNRDKYELFPWADRNMLAEQMPGVKKKFLLYADYAKVTMNELLGGLTTTGMTKLDCETTGSAWLENLGNGKFAVHTLPVAAQFAPVNAIIAEDINGDGNIDLLIAGNEYQNNVMTGCFDASYGLLLEGDGKGGFRAVPPVKSGFIIDGDVKSLKIMRTAGNKRILVAGVNDEKLKCFEIKAAGK
ncbi:MAG TPA: VCBS repeat-containing protein [Chitinophagaceae bacterium]